VRKEFANQKHLDKITQDDDIVRSLCKKLEFVFLEINLDLYRKSKFKKVTG
jgi:hypothetical protein